MVKTARIFPSDCSEGCDRSLARVRLVLANNRYFFLDIFSSTCWSSSSQAGHLLFRFYKGFIRYFLFVI